MFGCSKLACRCSFSCCCSCCDEGCATIGGGGYPNMGPSKEDVSEVKRLGRRNLWMGRSSLVTAAADAMLVRRASAEMTGGSHAAHPFTCKQRRWQMQAKALKKLQLELPGYTQKFCWSNWRGKRCELQHERVRRVREAEGNHRKPSIEKLREAGISL